MDLDHEDALACESCGSQISDNDDTKCRGCALHICQSCCDVFDHLENGLHGTGDPAEATRSLRARVEELEAKLTLRMTDRTFYDCLSCPQFREVSRQAAEYGGLANESGLRVEELEASNQKLLAEANETKAKYDDLLSVNNKLCDAIIIDANRAEKAEAALGEAASRFEYIRNELALLLVDEDLTDEKLQEWSEDNGPNLHDTAMLDRIWALATTNPEPRPPVPHSTDCGEGAD